MRIAIAATLAGAGVATATPAAADEQSFIDALHGSQFVFPGTEGAYVDYGTRVCAAIRGGATPESQYGMFSMGQGPNVVDAAQRELCPDTLG